MENVICFLESNMIPYHKSKLKFIVKGSGDNNIIIPGAIILFKSSKMFDHCDPFMILVRQISDIILAIPQEYFIYIYVESTNIDTYTTKLHDNLHESEMSFCEIINKHTITNIGYGDFSCVVDKCGPMWTMVVDKETRDKYKELTLYTDKITFDNATIIMTDEELNTLKNINFFFDTPPHKILCHISPTKIDKGHELFYHFAFSIVNKPLPGGKRNPLRHVDGRTSKCPNCHTLMYIKYVNDQNCVACKK